MRKKRFALIGLAVCVGLLVSCSTATDPQDASSSGGGTHAQLIIKNNCSKALVRAKVGFSTFTLNLKYGGTSSTCSLPVDSGGTKTIYAEWLGFSQVSIRSYTFAAGHTYQLTLNATPYAPLSGSTYLKNVSCSVTDITSN